MKDITEVLDQAIRKIPDFPKPGILFYDITGILMDPAAFSQVVEHMVEIYRHEGFGAIAAVESRGFLFAAPLAHGLGLPLILVRKKGKLPGEVFSQSFSLEYGEDVIEVQKTDVPQGQKVLLMDDLLATGGTLEAAKALLQKGGALVPEVFSVVGLPFLHPEEKLKDVRIRTLIDYHGE